MNQELCFDKHVQTSLRILSEFTNQNENQVNSQDDHLNVSFSKMIDQLLEKESDYSIQRLSQLIPEWSWLARSDKRKFIKPVSFESLCKKISSLMIELNAMTEEENNAYFVDEQEHAPMMDDFDSYSASSRYESYPSEMEQKQIESIKSREKDESSSEDEQDDEEEEDDDDEAQTFRQQAAFKTFFNMMIQNMGFNPNTMSTNSISNKKKKNKKNKKSKNNKNKKQSEIKKGRGRPKKRKHSELIEEEAIDDDDDNDQSEREEIVKKQKNTSKTSQPTKITKDKITKVSNTDIGYDNKNYIQRMKDSKINFKTSDLFNVEDLLQITTTLGRDVDYDTLRCNVIEYLNKYFACITGEGEFLIVEKQWNSERQIAYLTEKRSASFADMLKTNNAFFTIKHFKETPKVTIEFDGNQNHIPLTKQRGEYDKEVCKINVVNIWNNCPYRKSYSKRVFNPRPPHHPQASRPEELNCFIGLPFSQEECKRAYLNPKTKSDLDHVMNNLVLDVICDGNKNTMELLQSIHAHKLKYPWQKDEWFKIFYGNMGAGKSVYFKYLLGPQFGPYYKLVQNIQDFLGRFDSMKENTLIFVLDENLVPETPSQAAKLRAFITVDILRMEKKGKEKTEITNFIDIWAAANPPFPVHLDQGDRRTWIIQVSNKRVVLPDVKDAFGNIIKDAKNEENKEFWTNITQMMTQDNYAVAKAYQWYLMNEFKSNAFKKGMHPPSSNIKRRLIEKNSDEVQEFWQHCLINGEHCRWEELMDTKPEWIQKFTDRTGREIDPVLGKPKERWICEVSREELYVKFREYYPNSLITEINFFKKSQDVIKITNKKTVFKVDEESGKTFTMEEPLSHRFGYRKKVKLPDGSVAETISKDPVIYYKLAPHSEQLDHYLMTFKIDLRKDYEILNANRINQTNNDQEEELATPSSSLAFTTWNTQNEEDLFKKRRNYNKSIKSKKQQEKERTSQSEQPKKKRGRKKKNETNQVSDKNNNNNTNEDKDIPVLDKQHLIELFISASKQDKSLLEHVNKMVNEEQAEPVLVNDNQHPIVIEERDTFVIRNNNIQTIHLPTQSPPRQSIPNQDSIINQVEQVYYPSNTNNNNTNMLDVFEQDSTNNYMPEQNFVDKIELEHDYNNHMMVNPLPVQQQEKDEEEQQQVVTLPQRKEDNLRTKRTTVNSTKRRNATLGNLMNVIRKRMAKK